MADGEIAGICRILAHLMDAATGALILALIIHAHRHDRRKDDR